MSSDSNREQRKRAAELQKHFEECFSNGQCLGGLPGAICEKPPIRSHTIAKRWLRQIARQSHVYSPTYNRFHLEKVGRTIGFPLVSIHTASTLQMFCAEHDNELFRDLEANSFSPNARAAALLHFRAVCRETLTKLGANVASQTLQFYPPGEEIEALRIGQQAGLRDASVHYHHELRRLAANDFGGLRYYICCFERPLPFALVGAFLPEIDFRGNALADLSDFTRTPESVGVACFSDSEYGYCAITWDADGMGARQFAASFHRLASGEKADAALTLGFEFIENVALAPDWWEGLNKSARSRLLQRLLGASSASRARAPAALVTRQAVLDNRVHSWHSNEGLIYVMR